MSQSGTKYRTLRSAGENMRVTWARYEERVVEFLEELSELPNEYENVEDILNEAVEVVDLYGRLQPDKFREIWEKLNKRLRDRKEKQEGSGAK